MVIEQAHIAVFRQCLQEGGGRGCMGLAGTGWEGGEGGGYLIFDSPLYWQLQVSQVGVIKEGSTTIHLWKQ